MMRLFVMRCRICLCSLLLVCLHCSVVSNTYTHVSNTYRFVHTQMSVRVNLKIYILKCINKYCYKTFGIVVTKHLVLLLQNIWYCCFKTCCIVGTQHLVLNVSVYTVSSLFCGGKKWLLTYLGLQSTLPHGHPIS